MLSDAVELITDAVESESSLLVHDKILPMVTGLIAGEPVEGFDRSGQFGTPDSLLEVVDSIATTPTRM